MSTYRIAGKTIKSDDPALDAALASVHGQKQRPLCLCREPGVEMYIAKITGKFIVKRMPNSGDDHAPVCDSYEPPPELSGLGQVMGSAILENPDDGMTALKLDFSMTKSPSRAAPVASGVEADSVKTDGTKLTLRGTLHFLWDQAGYTRWTPAMQGKRNWFVIRKYLLAAAESKVAKGFSLAEMLYIPESFNVDKKDEIAQRRIAHTLKIATPQKGVRRLMLVIGEVKEIASSRYGYKVVLKHLADNAFMMNEDLHKRLTKRFEVELALWGAVDGARLIMIATFGVGVTGIFSLEEVAVMVVTDNYVPFDSTFDKDLIDAMTKANRRFIKGLRYNLPSTRPLACLVASDTQPTPTAAYIIPPGASEEYMHELAVLIDSSKMSSWQWRAGDVVMPALPPIR